MSYRGRFAPSPTGELHFGSLVAAVASYLDARANNGTWLIRIEDIDPPREQAGASEKIIQSLAAHGMHSDEPIRYQSQQPKLYDARLKELISQEIAFKCPCSRSYLNAHNGVHSEACRSKKIDANSQYAVKFQADYHWYNWLDQIQGYCGQILDEPFVLLRKDKLYAYQLAVVSDDIDTGITHVVRGADLLESTPMQLALYRAFNITPPCYSHIPLQLNSQGQKLSKQNLAQAIEDNDAKSNLIRAMAALNINNIDRALSIDEILAFGSEKWNPSIIDAARESKFSNFN